MLLLQRKFPVTSAGFAKKPVLYINKFMRSLSHCCRMNMANMKASMPHLHKRVSNLTDGKLINSSAYENVTF